MQPPPPLDFLRLLAPAIVGKSGPPSEGSRSTTMTEVSSFRPPCALWIIFISFPGASCSVHQHLHVKN